MNCWSLRCLNSANMRLSARGIIPRSTYLQFGSRNQGGDVSRARKVHALNAYACILGFRPRASQSNYCQGGASIHEVLVGNIRLKSHDMDSENDVVSLTSRLHQ